jgi:hypothetical protein
MTQPSAKPAPPPPPPSRPRARPYLIAGLIWLAAVIGLAGTGRLSQLQPPVPQLVILGLTVALILLGVALPGFRAWLATWNLRQLIAFHITRFVGIYFLILYGQGALPYDFAVPAGWGDIAVATAALVLVLFTPDLTSHRAWVLVWNVVGFLDIGYAVLTVTRLALADPQSVINLLRLPLSIVPTFLVPIIIASHVLIFSRLMKEQDPK